METNILGRTGLKVTAAGLGCGGFSRIGIAKYGLEHAAGIARAAYDAGVNFFDTATAYGTEEALGKGLEGIKRDSYILSSKFPYNKPGWREDGAERLEKTLDESLRLLKTDYLDVYHIHGVAPGDYEDARDILLPVMQRAQRQGKIRFPGITEVFGSDTSHQMLKQALAENHFDVIMVGYNMLNPSAARTVLPLTLEKGTGVLNMFAVRTALSNPEQLVTDISRILESGQGGPGLEKSASALDFLVQSGAAGSVMEAAYRFCRYTPGIHVTLTGTGSREHLADNLRSINLPPLPDEILARLGALFGGVDCVSGQ